jgi:thiamine biosynthesis lipoprotein
MKHLVLLFAVLMLISCGQDQLEIVNYGHAQGTTYSIKYITKQNVDHQSSIDSILIEIDRSMSLWVSNSIVSRVNRGDSNAVMDDNFEAVLKRSIDIGKETQGRFDVTIAPLVNAWGFNGGEHKELDSITVDSLLQLVDYSSVRVLGKQVQLDKNQQLDFNAIAQGYSVDVISDFLEANGVENYMVEVGGELKTKGKNSKGKVWRIGIDKPTDEINPQNRFQIVLSLPDKALATSGNYRKFFTNEEGEKFVHTINPSTGYPVKSKLLSATIITSSCMDADAYATACMVGGIKYAQQLIEGNADLDGYLVYSENGEFKEWFSTGFEIYN